MAIEIKNIIEALLFSSDRPLSVKQIKDIINDEKLMTGITIDIKKIEAAIDSITDKYSVDEYSFHLLEISGGYRFGTKKEYAQWLTKLNKEKLKRKLSQSAIETLAIIAYKQPITKPEIEAIRGVNVDYIVGSLLEKNLITVKGRADAPGRPILYGITANFLEYLGINSTEQLPPLKDISEIIRSSPPEGISQSDIDFYEEINLAKNKITSESQQENEPVKQDPSPKPETEKKETEKENEKEKPEEGTPREVPSEEEYD